MSASCSSGAGSTAFPRPRQVREAWLTWASSSPARSSAWWLAWCSGAAAGPGCCRPPAQVSRLAATWPQHHPRVQRKVETRLGPDGLTVVADGQTYHRLEDITDAGLREQVRKNLAGLGES